MIPLKNAVTSTVGRKFMMALTGLALGLFVIIHLLGNLSLYLREGTTFNKYAHALEGMGPLVIVAELGLLLFFGIHIVNGVIVTLTNKKARPVQYQYYKTKGGVSKNNVTSRNMIVSGMVLALFLVLHVWQFKFGPGMMEGYVQDVTGGPVRDLHRLVVETFRNPVFAGIYIVAMVFLWSHLKHGYWSAFQSLGTNNPRITGTIYTIGYVLAFLLAIGFLFIPVWIFFDIPGALK